MSTSPGAVLMISASPASLGLCFVGIAQPGDETVGNLCQRMELG
jgi:hypothetical protein